MATYWYGQGAGMIGDVGTSVEDLGDGRYRVTPQGYRTSLPGGGRGWSEGPSRIVRAQSPRDAVDVAAIEEMEDAQGFVYDEDDDDDDEEAR